MWPLVSRSLGWIRPKSAVTKGCQYVVAAQGPLRVHSTSNTAFQNDGRTLPTSHPSKTGTGQAGRWKSWHIPQPLGTEPEGKRVIWLHGSPAANTWAHQPRGCKATSGSAPPQPHCGSTVVSMNHWLLGRGFCHTGWKTWQGTRRGWLGWHFSLKQHKDLEYYNVQERKKSSVP